MAYSIYQIPNWAINTNYSKHDIYLYNSLYYYALLDHNSGATFTASNSGGVTTYNGVTKSEFIWTPSYNAKFQGKPMVNNVQFGDGYISRSPNGINTKLLQFSFVFEKRTDAEARAILHFLDNKNGVTSFVYLPPFPFNVSFKKIFVCQEYEHSQVFVNNHVINANFMESVT